jgi:PAS domain-containing protein
MMTLAQNAEEGQRQLRASEQWLRVTLFSIGDAVITTDSTGRVTFLNPVAESLTG